VPPDPTVPPSNGDGSTEPKRSLRDTLEAAWDKVVENAPDDNDEPDAGDDAGAQPPASVDNQGQPRDESGRWVRRDAQPGEAEQRPQQAEHPAPPTTPQQPQAAAPSPAQAGEAAQAPANWSAEDRAAFDEQTDRGKQFLLRRHSEMESFAQQRVQASAQAASFTQSLAPIFNDPVIAGSLREAGVGAAEAISQWGMFHRRFMTDPVPMIAELIQRSGVDPAVFARLAPAGPAAAQPGGALPLTQEQLREPAMRFIADHFGRQNSEIVGLRNELHAMRSAGEARQAQEVMRVTRWGIDSFAAETNEKGELLHPHFDAVLPHIITLFKANPRSDLREAYEQALWMDANTRGTMLQRERQTVQQAQQNQRAQQQVRSNISGRTHPVATVPRGDGAGKRSLRDVLEDAADKVGIE